ncbi:hypothetical protein ETAA8_10370 [Anatilimnocola aggregata]|uniref:DUF4261 domain-containing protein n=1 Tax=Anatilimnocola aggregata TaxID=2528021 RepID=A0A517Y6X1_9BACT|nr:DUF4261 domain-containing protein [Anatilimnocola aggregata]QDU25965.1 hypothetical protein ETAA8_10370 [Anatilimnocola aggregata]
MPKGIFVQCGCILLSEAVAVEEIERALASYEVIRRTDPGPSWIFGGYGLLVKYRPQVNGLVLVDIVNKPWPDGMGDPQANPELFGGWTMGQFGPFTFPGSLQRAAQQSWVWPAGKSIVGDHRAFMRVRCSYVLGAGPDAPVMAADADAVDELEHVTGICQALLSLPTALCYFNPNGEVLRDQAGMQESMQFADQNEVLPLDLWSNIRLFNISSEWLLMDTVGNSQLDLPDIEAIFVKKYDPSEIDNFLRNISFYLHTEGRNVIKPGDTMDGPGNIRWQARLYENGISDPPRPVLSWLPVDGSTPPVELKNRKEAS